MTAVAVPRWPDVVWGSPLLRGLDARARGEIEAAGRLATYRPGAVVFRPGDPADALYVVAEGACELSAVRRGESDATVIRRARIGDVFGEDATVAEFSTRQLEARATDGATVAEVPLVVFRRAVVRAGGAEIVARAERALRRAATLDLLRTTAFTRTLPDRDLDILLDAARHVRVARGEHVFRAGDAPDDAFFVADGLLQAQTDDDGKPRVEAYLSRGDVFGDGELESREGRVVSVVACGPTWLVAVARDVFLTVARRNAALLEGVRRVRTEDVANERRIAPGAHTTALVFRDLYRMRVARSLLVIDQDSCIRCGHCAWSCASAHDDGISRLVRRGDKVVVQTGPESTATAPLLVPNSCQHCKNPSCMIDCPTGAIGRDARGEVFIREDLCTGCGNCAKGCPWDNIQMAPRSAAAKVGAMGAFESVAVKCDLCSGVDGGPACVASCPTQAIVRIDPNAVLVELRPRGAAEPEAASVLPRRTAAWPWAFGAGLAGLAISAIAASRWTSGVLVGVLIATLASYSVLKRGRGLIARLRAERALSRPLYVAHMAVGAFTFGAAFAHSGVHAPSTAGGALVLSLALALASGVVGGVTNALVPRRLARLERKSVLPEELAAKRREIEGRVFHQLSGKSELVKTLYAKVLRPYHRRWFGAVLLVLSGRPLRAEEARVRAAAVALLAGHKSDKLDGLDDLVRLVVEHRAVRAQRLLTGLLRGWIAPHVVATGAALVLTVAHVIGVAGRP